MSFDYLTAGESHGPELTAVVEGVPAGLKLKAGDIDRDLARRQLGYGRGGRMKIESDQVTITSGVRHQRTMGSPIAMRIENADWRNWKEVMSAGDPADSGESQPVTVPRPGHADLAGLQKYGLSDIRDVLERASARETAARVAVGAVARTVLASFEISIYSHVVQISSIATERAEPLSPENFAAVDESPVRCLDERAAVAMMQAIDAARKDGESVGGVFEVVAFGLMPGLGSYASGPQRLGGRIGGALMSIPAIKGAEIGEGFALAAMPGSEAHDEIFFDEERGYYRKTNACGGLEGGITTGETLVARACMKPIPTLTSPLRSVDIASGYEAPAHKERSDVCAVPAAAVVGEAMVAIELARAVIEKFGGDSVADTREAYLAYIGRLRGSWPRR
jgi:chorismate synthase